MTVVGVRLGPVVTALLGLLIGLLVASPADPVSDRSVP